MTETSINVSRGGQSVNGRNKTTSSKKGASSLTTLKTYEAICASAVMEDCADQLAILGAIMPGSYESRKDTKQVKFFSYI